MSLFSELKRRNVFRVATGYLIVGWLLTEILATVLPMFGVPDWVGVAVVIVVALTFIPVLIFAWAFEITPEGIKREKDVDRDSSITSQTGKKLDYVTIAAVVIGVGFLAFSKNGTQAPEAPIEVTETSGAPSVAVLPFVNMSGNAENEYFSDGLTETLLHMLAQVPDIKVAARTSSFAFKGEEQDIRKIALALGVAHVLEGSVQRSGDKVRITAQLIRADDGFHVWSSIYDRQLNDIFAIQDEIAADVGKSLTTSLLGEEPVVIAGIGTDNIIAYDFYLQALSLRTDGSYGDLQRAEDLLKEALLLDGSFHDARTVLGIIYLMQQNTGLIEQDIAFRNAATLFEQVLAARPNDVSAKSSLIMIRAFQSENEGAYMAVADAVPELAELVLTAPNDVELRFRYALLLRESGQLEDAVSEVRATLLIDPVNAVMHYLLGTIHIRIGNLDEARISLNRSLEISPDQPNAYGQLGNLNFQAGNGVGAIENYLNAMALDAKDHELPSAIGIFLYRLGIFEEADEYRDRAVLVAPNSPGARLVGLESVKARHDRETGDRLARSMVADDIDERHGSYFVAVYTILSNAVAREDAAEGLEFIEHYQPGFNDPTSNEISLKARFAQGGAFAAWDAAFGREKASQMADDYLRIQEESGWLNSSFPGIKLEVLALRGETDSAIEFGLSDVFSKAMTDTIWYREIFDAPHLSEVVADPRVQARLRQWDEDVIRTRAEVKAFLDERG